MLRDLRFRVALRIQYCRQEKIEANIEHIFVQYHSSSTLECRVPPSAFLVPDPLFQCPARLALLQEHFGLSLARLSFPGFFPRLLPKSSQRIFCLFPPFRLPFQSPFRESRAFLLPSGMSSCLCMKLMRMSPYLRRLCSQCASTAGGMRVSFFDSMQTCADSFKITKHSI